MEIVDWSRLTAAQRTGLATLLWSEGDLPGYAVGINSYRRRRRTYQDYRARIALEEGRVVGHLGTVRVPFRTARRSQTICGICDVVIRPDATRRGFATRLLRRAHAEARAEGLDWSFLWTRRSWGAHRAYEKLGYFDLYSTPTAVRPPRAAAPRTSARLRVARRSDLPRVERLLSRASADRLGFVPRFPDSFRHRLALGWRTLEGVRLLELRGESVGYADVQVDPVNTIVRECVLVRPGLADAMLDGLEQVSPGRWIGFAHSSFISDHASELEGRGYRIFPTHHAVLMAAPLTPRGRRERAEIVRTVADPRFFVQRGDQF